jgi:hypothetical protein
MICCLSVGVLGIFPLIECFFRDALRPINPAKALPADAITNNPANHHQTYRNIMSNFYYEYCGFVAPSPCVKKDKKIASLHSVSRLP